MQLAEKIGQLMLRETSMQRNRSNIIPKTAPPDSQEAPPVACTSITDRIPAIYGRDHVCSGSKWDRRTHFLV